jgi:hypothetical protein
VLKLAAADPQHHSTRQIQDIERVLQKVGAALQ